VKKLTLEVTDKQHDLLRRIAITDRYKLNDLVRLVFATGLEYQWCENYLSFKKKDDEFSVDNKKQIAKNKKIEKELAKKDKKVYQLTKEEEDKLGYKRVDEHHFVGGYGDEHDVAHMIADQLRESLLNKETGNYGSGVAQ